MREVITKEAADEMIELWADALEREVPADMEIKNLKHEIQYGRIDFDEEKESFEITLKKPIELENGETISIISIREPTTRELQQSSKGTKNDELAMMIKLISAISGHPLGVIERMKQRDLITISEAYNFFA